MCGTMPFGHWPESKVSISTQARSGSKAEKPQAAKALSQFHW